MAKTGYVYILTNASHRVLYTGVTADLARRMSEHRKRVGSVFARRYRASILVYYEVYDHIGEAIGREKMIKAGSRQRKVDLILEMNPEWRDLADDFL